MNKRGGWKLSEATKQKMREHHPHLSRPHTEEEKRKLSEHWKLVGHPKGMLGKHHSDEAKRKMSEKRRGKDNSFWKGGITTLMRGIRRSPEYYQWRKAVLERDNHICQDCGATKQVDAHHIQSIVDYPEGIFEVNNGLTICGDCHNRHTFWQKLKKKHRKRKEKHGIEVKLVRR